MNNKVIEMVSDAEKALEPIFKKIDENEYQNSIKVLNAFKNIIYLKVILWELRDMVMVILEEIR